MAPGLVCYFLITNLATILPLKFKFSEKFQHFNALDGTIKMMKIAKFPKISIKMKHCKTFYEAQTASHLKEIIQPLIQPTLHKI